MDSGEQRNPATSSDITCKLPFTVNEVDQYWGSFVLMSGIDSLGNDGSIRLLYSDWTIAIKNKEVSNSNGDPKQNTPGFSSLIGCKIDKFQLDEDSGQITLSSQEILKITIKKNLSVYDDIDRTIWFCFSDSYVSYYPKTGLVTNLKKDTEVGEP